MNDPLGLIRATQPTTPGVGPASDRLPGGGVRPDPDGPSFKDVLMENLRKVNELQKDATTAIEDLQTGKRNDLETVLMATAKADTAFRMLLSVRNKMVAAYDEIRQIRV